MANAVRNRVREPILTAATSRILAPVHRLLTRNAASIFMLHRFADPERGIRGHDPDVLRAVLRWLRDREIPLLSLGEVVSRVRQNRPLNGGVAFTVDDGYRDFATVGLNVFAEYDCPVTVFLATELIDSSRLYWWDRIRHVIEKTPASRVKFPSQGDGDPSSVLPLETESERRSAWSHGIDKYMRQASEVRERNIALLSERLGVSPPTQETEPRFRTLSWEEIGHCAGEGVRFAPHTLTHPWLTSVTDEEARREIEESWRRVREKVPNPLPVFCYPYGTAESYGTREVEILRDIGLDGAVSAVPEMVSPSCGSDNNIASLYGLPRFGFPNDTLEAKQICTGIIRLRHQLA